MQTTPLQHQFCLFRTIHCSSAIAFPEQFTVMQTLLTHSRYSLTFTLPIEPFTVLQEILVPMIAAGSLHQIATTADCIFDFTHHTTTAAAATLVPVVAAMHDRSVTTIKELCKQLASLTKRLDDYFREQCCSPSRDTGDRRRSASCASTASYCWYPTTFGENAHGCRKSCTYSTTTVGKLTLSPDSTGQCSFCKSSGQNSAIFVMGPVSSCKFLMDTGSSVSLWSFAFMSNKLHVRNFKLHAVNCSPILIGKSC